ncbi:MAG: hypothetical protein WD906_04850 [Anaerolineales bacterium]
MNLGTIAALTGILLSFALAYLRLPSRPRRWIVILLGIPGSIFLCRWTTFRGTWAEAVISFVASLLILWIWWSRWGRLLPAPHAGNIRVWTKEDPF